MRFPSLLALTLALYLPTVFSAPQHDHGSGTDPGDDDHHGTPEPLEGSGQVGAPLPAGFLTEGPIDINSPPPTPGAKHVKKRYGPYSMKAGATLNRMITPEAPCTNCFITKMTSSLEYEDGSEANINTGSWLHHMVVYQRAGRGASAKIDPVCPSRILPRRRIFAVGNERTNKRFNAHHKAGIKIDEGDTLSCIMELMNESAETRVVYLTISAEFVSGAAAQGYSPVQLAWLDATGCGASNVPAQEGQYQLKTPVWKSTIAGKALLGTGHTHDGGVNLTIFKNNQPWCVSQMIYGRRAEVVEPKSGNGGHAGHNMPHISDAGTCRDFGDVKVGDELYAISYYDAVKYPPMIHNGEAHPVMGNANIYIA